MPNRGGEVDRIRWGTSVGDGGNDRSQRVRGTESSEVRRVGVGQDAVASISWREGLRVSSRGIRGGTIDQKGG